MEHDEKPGADAVLTPYDTGERCEPKPWQPDRESVIADMGDPEHAENIGNVDFDDDCGDTVCTVHVSRAPDGRYVLHVMPMVDMDALAIAVHHGKGLVIQPIEHGVLVDVMIDDRRNI